METNNISYVFMQLRRSKFHAINATTIRNKKKHIPLWKLMIFLIETLFLPPFMDDKTQIRVPLWFTPKNTKEKNKIKLGEKQVQNFYKP